MKEVLVIGCGNTLRGDDAAGVRAAELIAVRRPDIDCLFVHQLMPELAEQIAEYRAVIFLDADANATELSAHLIAPSDGTEQPRTHFLSPESLLALCRLLYQRVPATAYSIGIPATEFEFSEQLSSSTERAVGESIRMVEHIITRVQAMI
jgi:hydrogenase maturation protease